MSEDSHTYLPPAFKLGFSASMIMQALLARLSQKATAPTLPSLSLGVISGFSVNYFDLWRHAALEDVARNHMSDAFVQSLYQHKDCTRLDLVKYYSLKFASENRGSFEPRKLHVLDRLALRVVNWEVNFRMQRNLDLRYDLHLDELHNKKYS